MCSSDLMMPGDAADDKRWHTEKLLQSGHVGGQVVYIRKKVLLAQSISSPTVMCALD